MNSFFMLPNDDILECLAKELPSKTFSCRLLRKKATFLFSPL